MIRTKDLVEFIKSKEIRTIYHNEVEYIAEIVARLQAYDELRESIEKLTKELSFQISKT